MNIRIRSEKSSDIDIICDITTAAFLNAAHAGHTEQFIVRELRDAGVLTISLVAEAVAENGALEVVGHVAVSPVTITDGANDWYGLGPISVLPSEQAKGIGKQLMHAAIAELEALGAGGCVLLGNPNYYYRFGFKPVDGLLLADVPAEYFQAKLLKGSCPQGMVSYHEGFAAEA